MNPTFNQYHIATLDHFEGETVQLVKRLHLIRDFYGLWGGYPNHYATTLRLLSREIEVYSRMLGSIIWC